jgi:A/G-specific adenine glycosylase
LSRKLANDIVDGKRPGDFNQALMELGAVVCTPKSPSCATCPVKSCCKALELTKSRGGLQKLVDSSISILVQKSTDIEDCELCLPVQRWQPSCGVTNFPHKSGKAKAKEEQFAVIIIHYQCRSQQRYLITQRPAHGLLASFWEFPSVPVDSSWSDADMKKGLAETLESYTHSQSVTLSCLEHIGQVKHTFSHRLHVYHVYQTEVTTRALSHLQVFEVCC